MNLILNDPMAVPLIVSELPEDVEIGIEDDTKSISVNVDDTTTTVSLSVAGLSEEFKMEVKNDEETILVDIDTVIVVATGETYTGPYDVIPVADGDILLETKNKHMLDNVKVHEIPYYEVSNPSGGETVYIAREVAIDG